ncbi:MAG: ABC transporter permease [Pseudomonadota bacterium]|jgi:ABC-2 type transport system permease protein
MIKRILSILRKEFIHVLRDKRLRLMLITPPLIQLIVLGYAIDMDVHRASLAVLDMDRTPLSRSLVDSVTSTGKFVLMGEVANAKDGVLLLDEGKIDLFVQIQPGFMRKASRGEKVPVQVLVDGSDSTFAGLVVQQLSGTLAQFAGNLAGTRIEPAFIFEDRGLFNTNFKSRNFFVPGVIALIVMIITLMLTAMAVVREKELGTLDQLMVSPVSPLEILLGKTIPFAIIAFGEVAFVTTVAILLFQIPIRGSVILLFISTGLYLLSCLGAGLLISTVSRTQQQAMMSTFLFVLPAILLSGFAFPIHNMPTVIQALTYLDPLRYFLVIIRGIFLKGVGTAVLWPQMVGLLILGLAAFGAGVAGFRRGLE